MITIGFISDIHYGELARSKEFTLPNQAPKGATQNEASITDGLVQLFLENRVQYLFVGGDLTSRARPQEFFHCEKKIVEIAEKANIPLQNVIVGIGNHDIDWQIAKLEALYRDSGEEEHNIAKEGYRSVAGSVASHNMQHLLTMDEQGPVPLSGIVKNEFFIAFVLNSALFCTPDQQYSHGKLSDAQLSWFVQKANEYRDAKQWKIVLLHHHPHNYAYHKISQDISTLEEGSELLEAAGKAGIDLILHGHRHHPRAETIQKSDWSQAMTFVCGGSLSVNAEHRSNGDIPNTFHILQLSDNVGELTLLNYEYSASEGWKPLCVFRPETPLDAKMKLGRMISEEQAKQLIRDMGAFDEKYRQLSWDDYADTLQFMRIESVNQLMADTLSSKYMITGQFPKSVILIKKEENGCEM